MQHFCVCTYDGVPISQSYHNFIMCNTDRIRQIFKTYFPLFLIITKFSYIIKFNVYGDSIRCMMYAGDGNGRGNMNNSPYVLE